LQINGRRADVTRDKDDNDFFIMFNAGLDTVNFIIPPATYRKQWYRAVDTSKNSPYDILSPGSEEALKMPYKYWVNARSVVILLSKTTNQKDVV
jgi:glycogen operon protein